MSTVIGIVGVGGVARYAHLPAYLKNNMLVKCICDTNIQVANEIGQQFGISNIYSSAEEMIAKEDIDIVDVATPPSSHLEILEICARYHKRVLMQKPIIVTLDQYNQLDALINKLPSFRVNLQGRYVSAWQKVKQILESKSLGSPLLCTINNQDWWDRQPERWDNSIRNYIVFEMLIHHIDLCIYWFGRPEKVTARGGINPQQTIKNTNYVSVMLEYKSGLIVQIVENWCMSEYKFATGHPYEDILITCSNGVIKANSEMVESSQLGDNVINTFLLPRPGQILSNEMLLHNWFCDAFGEIMNDYMINGQLPDIITRDKEHALYITKILFSISRSLESDLWITL